MFMSGKRAGPPQYVRLSVRRRSVLSDARGPEISSTFPACGRAVSYGVIGTLSGRAAENFPNMLRRPVSPTRALKAVRYVLLKGSLC